MRNGVRAQGKRKSPAVIPKQSLKEVQAEARAFGLSTKQYLKLSVDLSRLLRESIPSAETVKPEQWMNVVNNPIIGIALRSLSALIANSHGEAESGTPEPPSSQAPEPQTPEPQGTHPRTPETQNVIPREYWYM